MTLATNNDRKLGSVGLSAVFRVQSVEGLQYLWKLLFQDGVELALNYIKS